MQTEMMNYGTAIREGFAYLLKNYPEFIIIGQGVWSPWYVGNSMSKLEVEFGKHRVIDTPVSEAACTGVGVGASLCGYKVLVVHPRVDFMILATDTMVNQAAKWSYMLAGQAHPQVTIRGIINRGGEQGAQHSQALHSWFAHIPGLRVVMPATVQDARDLLIASVLSPDPVLFIDDRWLYEREAILPEVTLPLDLAKIKPNLLKTGSDLTIVGSGYSSYLAEQLSESLLLDGISSDVIDLRVLNPLDTTIIQQSVEKTGRLVVIDGGWKNCGMAGEIIASVAENIAPTAFKMKPLRFTLPDCPAPTSRVLEKAYYPEIIDLKEKVLKSFVKKAQGSVVLEASI